LLGGGDKIAKVRRLSTESYAKVQSDIGFYTQWRWYWKDDHGNWNLYEKVFIRILNKYSNKFVEMCMIFKNLKYNNESRI